MNAPNFSALAAANRAIDEEERRAAEERRKATLAGLAAWRKQYDERLAARRKKWVERPMREDEVHVHGELVSALRGLPSYYPQTDVAEWLYDHFASVDGMAEFERLMQHVADEEPQKAWEQLSRSLELVAKWKREDEVDSYEDFDARR